MKFVEQPVGKGTCAMARFCVAGAATADITPSTTQFLFGYPHVPRYSTGVHDPLLSSALYLSDGSESLLFVASDIIFVSRDSTQRVRRRIAEQTGITARNIMITATHTHSGPLTADMLSNEADPIVPKVDMHYVAELEDGILTAAVAAFSRAKPAEFGFAIADSSCVGTHRHNPNGPAIPETPVVVVRDRDSHTPIAAMIVCSMHPTVLHEDSTLISGDFPAMTRRYLQEHVFGKDCPIVYHMGPSGNQSPRHRTRENTFAEAERLGNLLGRSIESAIGDVPYVDRCSLRCMCTSATLPPRSFSLPETAASQLEQAVTHLDHLRRTQADPRDIRTAECDWFGAEEALTLAKAAKSGRVQQLVDSLMPAEIQLMQIGPWSFVGWPCEVFVEFEIAIRKKFPKCFVISLANGELQGYIVTEEAVANHWYEGMNSLFASPEAGMALVNATLDILHKNATRGTSDECIP
jgi:hypothetical protein